MRTDGRESSHLDDRRGQRAGRGRLVGGGIGALVVALIAMAFGVDPRLALGLLGQDPAAPASVSAPATSASPQDDMGRFVSVVLADTEDTWNPIFQAAGRQYQEPRLVLFSGATRTACGTGQRAAGPFYCPLDQSVYIDLAFYEELQRRFKAPGDFAQAYVIAHEVGHHVQNQLGIMNRVQTLQQSMPAAEANRLSVQLELQADCLAGLWANHAHRARQVIEPGDIDEALRAAAAIGDDTLQKASQGYVVPDSFTHGSSEQRARWFRIGWQSGQLAACDTFAR
ncbi:MAG: neutral zinc metallopeptidase [Burkholderiaceae bacterium]